MLSLSGLFWLCKSSLIIKSNQNQKIWVIFSLMLQKRMRTPKWRTKEETEDSFRAMVKVALTTGNSRQHKDQDIF